MRGLPLIVPVVLLVGVQAPSWAQQTQAAKNLPSHPAEVALVDEGERGTVYRRFPTGQRLYTFDRDRPGRSACTVSCALAWPPVTAPAGAVATGDWTVVTRPDGSRQWALKGKPVYTRFHDAPDAPIGDAAGPAWRLVPYTPSPANPTLTAVKR